MGNPSRRRSSFFAASPLLAASTDDPLIVEEQRESTETESYYSAPNSPSAPNSSRTASTRDASLSVDESHGVGYSENPTGEGVASLSLGLPGKPTAEKPARSALLNRQNSLPPMMPSHPTKVHDMQADRHFLQGINPESHQNLLTIPDPPTPGRSRSRRQSSPMVRPLKSLSSNDLHQYSLGDTKMPAVGKPKRPRKSLCHVPAPERTILDTAEDGTTETSLEPTFLDAAVSDATGQHNADPKRRKKRQSIVLPSDTNQAGSQEYFQTFMTFKKAPTTVDQGRSVHAPESHIQAPESAAKFPAPTTNEELEKLRKLVHAYTTLPINARANCKEIQSITELNGYVVTPPVTSIDQIDPALSAHASTRLSKMDLLVQMGPKLAHMDKIKIQQVQKAQCVTECYVEKKKGRYCYYHAPTNKRIAADEYEQRYMLMLEETNKIRRSEWTHHFAALVDTTKPSPKASVSEMGNRREPDLPSNEMVVQDEALEESMDVCETSMSLDMGDDDSLDVSMDKQETGLLTQSPGSKDQLQETDAPPSEVIDDSERGTLTPMLPFPCRDEESSDPDIAAAEQRLWASIDDALDEYSREVLEIEERRKQDATSC